MKILFVAPRFHTNQVQLVKKLLEKEHEVYFHVACTGPTEDHSLVKPVQFKQSRLSVLLEKLLRKDRANRRYYFPRPFGYWRFFRQLKPEMVIIRDPYKIFAFIAACFARLTKAKIIFYTQEDIYRHRTSRTFLKQQLTIRLFNAAWITPVKSNRLPRPEKVLNHMYHVPLPVMVDDKYCNHLPGEGPKILMIGKYHQERKKHLLLLQALGKLKDRYRFRVTIAGECASEAQQRRYEKIRETARELGLDGRVEWKQNIPYNEMAGLYATHHIFVLPAINEQYGVSVNEALGFGLPVICTDTCGARFNISNGDNGYVIKSGSLEALTAALETLLADYHELQRMQKQSLQYACDHLSADVFYTKLARVTRERFSVVMN